MNAKDREKSGPKVSCVGPRDCHSIKSIKSMMSMMALRIYAQSGQVGGIGLLRDLRGLAQFCRNRSAHLLCFFAWALAGRTKRGQEIQRFERISRIFRANFFCAFSCYFRVKSKKNSMYNIKNCLFEL